MKTAICDGCGKAVRTIRWFDEGTTGLIDYHDNAKTGGVCKGAHAPPRAEVGDSK